MNTKYLGDVLLLIIKDSRLENLINIKKKIN